MENGVSLGTSPVTTKVFVMEPGQIVSPKGE